MGHVLALITIARELKTFNDEGYGHPACPGWPPGPSRHFPSAGRPRGTVTSRPPHPPRQSRRPRTGAAGNDIRSAFMS